MANIKVQPQSQAPRLIVADDTSYAILMRGPMPYPDGSVKVPGPLSETFKAVAKAAEDESGAAMGRSVSVPSEWRAPQSDLAEWAEESGPMMDRILLQESLPLLPASYGSQGGQTGQGEHMLSSSGVLDLKDMLKTQGVGGPIRELPISGHVLFAQGATWLTRAAQEQLLAVVEAMGQNRSQVEIVSYAGPKGNRSSAAHGLALRRAQAVHAFLTARGVDQTRLSVEPVGGIEDDGPQERVDIFFVAR